MEKRSKSTSFSSDVIKLVSGTTFAQGLLLIAAPLLARLYSPEAYGTFAIFLAFVNIFSVVSCLRYEMAIMLPEKEEEAANVLAVSVIISIGFSLILVPLLWLFGPLIVELFNVPEILPYLWMIPVAVFFGGIAVGHPGLNYWITRLKEFGKLSIINALNSIFTVTAQIIAAVIGYKTSGSLIGATLFGSSISTIVLGFFVWFKSSPVLLKSISWRAMFDGIKRYKKFPQYDAWAVLLNTLSWQLPALLLSLFFSPLEVGFYAIGNRLLRTPMNLIGNSVGQVFFQRAQVAKAEGNLANLVENVFSFLVLIGLFPMLVLSIIGSDIFFLVLGSEWTEAGIYTQILSIWMFFWFISSPLSTLFRVLEKQEFSLFINVLIFGSRFIALGIGGLLGDARLAIFLFACSGIVLYGYLSFSTMVISGVGLKTILRILAKQLVVFIPFGTVLSVSKLLSFHPLFIILLAGLSFFLYVLYIFNTDKQVNFFVHQTISRAFVRFKVRSSTR